MRNSDHDTAPEAGNSCRYTLLSWALESTDIGRRTSVAGVFYMDAHVTRVPPSDGPLPRRLANRVIYQIEDPRTYSIHQSARRPQYHTYTRFYGDRLRTLTRMGLISQLPKSTSYRSPTDRLCVYVR